MRYRILTPPIDFLFRATNDCASINWLCDDFQLKRSKIKVRVAQVSTGGRIIRQH